MSQLITTTPECPRCGLNHLEVPLHEFQQPAGPFTHWGTCPTTGEPLLTHANDHYEAGGVRPQYPELADKQQL